MIIKNFGYLDTGKMGKKDKTNKLNIAVIYDYACTCEGSRENLTAYQDISKQIELINSVLSDMDYSVFPISIGSDVVCFLQTIRDGKVDLVFNLCESVFGESTKEMNIPAMLDLLNLPYTGSGALTLGLTLDKGMAKRILVSNKIKTPECRIFYKEIGKSDDSIIDGLKFPLIIKPLLEHGSLGISQKSVVTSGKQLVAQVNALISKHKQPAIVEEFIAGREIYVPIIGNKNEEVVLAMSEIDFTQMPKDNFQILSYIGKWETESAEYQETVPVCPIDLPRETYNEIKDIALKVFRLMDCRDYARIDIRLTEDNIPYVIDVNPNPCLDEDAGLAISAKVSGIEYPELINRIVHSAMGRANGNGYYKTKILT
ncbi:MAG: ATP-grasp domain-containing protein [bacterium]|nr:ATP-grasp domain-containing protein [bacterium]